MRRVIKIILVLLLILALVAVSAWMFARKKASNEGRAQPTFRQFIALQSPEIAGEKNPDNFLTLENQNETLQTPENSSQEKPELTTISVSRFTNSPIIPSTSIQKGQISTAFDFQNREIPSGQLSIVNNTTNQQGAQGFLTQTSTCNDDDINIAFTSSEIARLNDLQNEFMEIAAYLHTDGDTQTEERNYIIFKDKVDTVTELYNYCQSKGFQITTTPFKNRIATPFWRMPGQDKTGYLTNGPWDDGVADPRIISETQMMLEQLFKIHLW